MPSTLHRIASMLVHGLTASGAACGLAALVAAGEGRERAAFLWLLAALAIDGIDGPLARQLRIASSVPTIDGALLDNVVDYLTYVVVPAILVHHSGLLPPGVSFAAAAWICIVSAIQFAHAEAKTSDGLFRGFPSCWNVVALYLLLLRPPVPVTLGIVAVLGALSFAPLYCVYPNRTPLLRRTTIACTVAWIASLVAIVARFPDYEPWLVGASLAYLAYYAALSIALTLRRGPRL